MLLLTPTLGSRGLLEFGALLAVAEEGYQAMREPIASWWAARAAGEVGSRDAPP